MVGLDQLTRLIRRFSVEQQQVPKDLTELVALKYLEAVPPAPVGQKFVIDRWKVEVRLEPVNLEPNGAVEVRKPNLRSPLVSNPDGKPGVV